MAKPPFLFALLLMLVGSTFFYGESASAQSPTGPITPEPGTPVQQPPQSKIVTHVTLVNTPVTVKNSHVKWWTRWM